VRLNRKLLLITCACGLLLLTVGCSGINASKSISPATFLLPGLMKADPPSQNPDPTLPEIKSEPSQTVARL
jgi:hypothetical protein